jgi:hypothetical protein
MRYENLNIKGIMVKKRKFSLSSQASLTPQSSGTNERKKMRKGCVVLQLEF